MKNIFLKLVFMVAFILNFVFCGNAFAQNLGITSVVYDNSTSFLTINSQDNFDYEFAQSPKLNVVAAENKAYFDIPNAILKCSFQDLVVKSNEVKEIVVSQFSTEPAVVRVVFYYNEGFNPYNIQLKKLNNTLFLKFNNVNSNNYYFQGVYQEVPVGEFFEAVTIKDKLKKSDNSLFNQINSSFGAVVGNTDEPNYILSEKDLMLRTKYYIDDIAFKGAIPIITGAGSFTVGKPMYLSNPSRAVFDISNAVVNPAIRNEEINFGTSRTIKIGQFDRNTARVVITDNEPEKYVPVIYPDSQRLAFIDLKNISSANLYKVTTDLTSVKPENTDKQNYGTKFVFSKPLIFGLERGGNSAQLYFFNVNSYNASDMARELKNTPFDDIKISDLPAGGIKLSLTREDIENVNVHIGADGKTLRLRTKLSNFNLKNEPKSNVTPIVVPNKISGKKYIVLDPGHGGSDVGATRNNIYEKNITLDVAKRVETLLIKKGYVVQMTRNDDSTVSLQARVEFSEQINPDIFVSIHVNSSNSDSPSGIETHYYKDNSLNLAKHVHASLLNNINSKDRGLFKSKFYVINHTTAPAILVEMGFISNPSERAQLVSESRKNATAKAIAEGIDEYFKQ